MTPQPASRMPDPQASAPASAAAEIKLQEAHDRLKATLEALPDLLFVLDRNGRIYDYHAPSTDRLYVPPDQFLGRKMVELLPEPAGGIIARALQDAVAHGHHYGSVYPLPTPGGPKWFEISIAAQGDPQSPEGRLVAIVRDITERKQTEDALRESEARFDQSARQSRTAVWEIDPDGLYTFMSRGVEDVLDYRADDLVGKFHFYDLHPENGREALKTAVMDIIRNQQVFQNMESICLSRDGTPVWIVTTGHPILNPDGTLRGYRGTTRDITDRKRGEDALRLFKESVENASDAVGMSTPEGKHYYQNRAFDELFGPVGENPPDTLYADSAVGHEVFRTIMAGGHWTGEVQMHARDGRILDIFLRAYANKDENGRITALLGIHTDITARKRAEEALQESEQKYRMLTESMKDVVWVLDVQARRFRYVSPSVTALRGYTPKEILARPLEEAWAPQEREILHQYMAGRIADFLAGRITEQTYFTIEMLQPCKDGSVVPSEVVCHLVRNPDSGRLELHGVTRDITERKRAEEALRESEQRLTQIARQSRMIAWELDPEGRYTFIGPVAEEVLGYRPDEIVGKFHHYDLHPEEGREAFTAEVTEFMRQQIHVVNYENPIQTKKGDIAWVSTHAEPLLNPDGTLRGYRGSDLDITERKRAELALRESEKKYRELHETMRDAFCLVDMHGQIVEVNPAFLVLTGYSEQELRTLTYLDLTPAKWHAAEARIVAEQVLPRGYSDIYQKEYIRADGTPVPVELRTTLLRDEAGHPTGMWATIRDITSRLRIERALKQATTELDRRVKERTADLEASRTALAESEEQFRQMAESIQEVFWLLDAQTGNVLYMSPAFEEIWRRSPREFLSGVSTWLTTLHPDDRDRVYQDFLRGRETGVFTPMEYRILRPDGSIRWIQDNAWAIRDSQGAPCRVAGVFHDITDRRRLEAEILNAAEAERQRIGRDLHDSLGQSLTGIGYLAEALKETLARNARREAADAAKLARLIENVAGSAHAMARGLLLVDLKRGGLAPALQELAFRTQELFGMVCRYNGLAEVDLTDLDVAGQLYRIAQEASTNAAKHGKGTTTIEIGLDRTPEGLLLSIRDMGQGLPGTSTNPTGLGLDIMRYRAGLIGASLWIDSQPHQGTTVNCLLPRPTPPPESPP